MKTDHQFNTLV